MPKCKNCNNLYNLSNKDDVIVGKWCPKINDSPHLDMERDCKHYKAMTNADRIRSMTDEELAEFLPIASDFICQPTEECIRNTVTNHCGECERTEECEEERDALQEKVDTLTHHIEELINQYYQRYIKTEEIIPELEKLI